MESPSKVPSPVHIPNWLLAGVQTLVTSHRRERSTTIPPLFFSFILSSVSAKSTTSQAGGVGTLAAAMLFRFCRFSFFIIQ